MKSRHLKLTPETRFYIRQRVMILLQMKVPKNKIALILGINSITVTRIHATAMSRNGSLTDMRVFGSGKPKKFTPGNITVFVDHEEL
jgi:hypothetical protein